MREFSVDPDQLASEKPADLDLHYFKNRMNRVKAVRQRQNKRQSFRTHPLANLLLLCM